MENNFNEDNFEEFLQSQLRNHRMFPKDSVWREINHKLHGEKRWPALSVASLLLIGATTFICLHFSSRQNIFSTKPILVPLQSEITSAGLNQQSNSNSDAIRFNTSATHQAPMTDQVSPTSNETVATTAKGIFTKPTLFNASSDNVVENKLNILPSPIPVFKAIAPQNNAVVENSNQSLISQLALEDLAKANIKLNERDAELIPPTLIPNNETFSEVVKNNSTVNIVEEKTPTLIENFKAAQKPGKFNMLVYLAPSISYRKLVEDQAVLKGDNNGPVGVNQVADVNDVVRHKPSKGIEGGVSLLYDFTKKIRIRSGFQFNIRQYTIDAYKSNTEVSSIALVEDNGIDTLNTIVFYRNFNGNSSAELINRYYQISLPLGLEWEVLGNKRFQFSIAGSIQPTYILNRSAYLLTTNFKNYSENDNFVRQWNINSNFEAFVSMVVGDVKWQLGPQIRYQPNSSFISKYPIREHLIDYGIKLGISTRIK